MKQSYFSSTHIQAQAQAMLAEIPRHRQRRKSYLDRSRSALLVLDMQQYFFAPDSHAFIPSALAIVPGVQRLIKTFYQLQRPVFFTQHSNTPQDAGQMATWWHDLILPHSPGSQLIAALEAPEREILNKSQYDAFFGTSLEERLKRRGVTQVVICGVMTHLCCETTARSAFMRGFEVFFTVDGTATYSRDFHTATLLNLSHGFAVPVLVEEVLEALKAEPAHG